MEFRIIKDWPDFAALAAVERAAAERYRDAGYDPADWAATRPDEFLEYQANGLLWVAAVHARALGFVMCDIYGDSMHIEEIDVLPEFQGQGIGKALLVAAISRAGTRGMKRVTLRTFHTTPWSVGLYRKLGFDTVAPLDLPPYIDAIIEGERDDGFPMNDRITMVNDLR